MIVAAPVCPYTRDQIAQIAPHLLSVPRLLLARTFHPFGFATEVRTNDTEILEEVHKLWSVFKPRFQNDPIRVDVHVTPGGDPSCPPEPQYHIIDPLVLSSSDPSNLCVVDLLRCTTQIIVTERALCHRLWFRQFFLEGAASCHIGTRFATPVHAACVALNGRGLLLCGDSGAGKSTLAYACARAGLQYVSDDACFLPHNQHGREVIGNCHQFRMRPSAAELFPEVRGLEITPRAAGKPSIVIPSTHLPHVAPLSSAFIDAIVFLDRQETEGNAQLSPYPAEAARRSMRKVIFGPRDFARQHLRAIEHLLTAPTYKLTYRALDPAIACLRSLMEQHA